MVGNLGRVAQSVTLERSGDADVAFSVLVREPNGGESQISTGPMVACIAEEYRRCAPLGVSNLWSDKDVTKMTILRPHQEQLDP